MSTLDLSELHHRYHELLVEYWDDLRGTNLFPAESQIEPEDIAEIWPWCFLISIDDVTKRLGYRYSYLGSGLIEAFGDDSGNPDVAMKLLATNDSSIIQKFDEVVTKRKQMIDESEFINLKNLKIKYRTCCLPLGVGEQVTHILGLMRWRVY
ncbi:MAG: PAS domain-containing protein [Rickettsiales bacterium]|nr:PAS domain-containing protein [Rickettsiales bacterium]